MGVPKMYRCSNCRSDGSSIGAFGACLFIYECSACDERFCHRCDAGYNATRSAHGGKRVHFREVEQVWKS